MYIKKSIETGHKITAECWDLDGVKTKGNATDGYNCSGNLKLYVSKEALDDGALLIDNCTFSYDGFTEEEITGNTPQAIIGKIMESVMSEDEEPIETNLLNSSHSGKIGFQDAEVIV